VLVLSIVHARRSEAPTPEARDDERLLDLARTQLIDDANVRACWEFVTEAIQARWIVAARLGSVIARLSSRGSHSGEEFSMDWDDDETMAVHFISEERRCAGDVMIAELVRLQRRLAEARADQAS
jgi:hypothetical protein